MSLEVSSCVCRGPGSQIEDRAVTQGVVGHRERVSLGTVTGCRWRCNLLMCVRVRVCRSKTGLSSHRVSLKLSSDAQISEGVVTEGVIGGDRCHLMRVRVYFLYEFLLLFGYISYPFFGLSLAQEYIYGERCIF